MCRKVCNRNGHSAVVVLDSREGAIAYDDEILTDFNRGYRGLFGSDAAIGIFKTMLQYAEKNDIVARVDADTLLMPQAFEWMDQDNGKANGFSVGKKIKWWGVFSVPTSELPGLIRIMESSDICKGCPTSMLAFQAISKTCGTEIAHPESVQVWRKGRDIAEESCVITLPTRMTADERANEAEFLFLNFGDSAPLPP